MHADPNCDTQSPWYECFDQPEAAVVVQARPQPKLVVAPPAPPPAPVSAADGPDGAADALFDYYNA